MSHDQGAGSNPYWSAAGFGQLDWRGEAERLLKEAPSWVLLAIAGAVLVIVLIAGFLAQSRSSKQKAERETKHSEAVAAARKREEPLPPKPLHMDPKPMLGGIAVSLNGLWGFAQDTVQLSFFFAVGFVTMFDVLMMRLFSQMYSLANDDPRRRWTRQLKRLRFTAWVWVLASVAANVAHSPSVVAAPFLAIMPIGAAWLIYVPLQNALEEDAEEETRPEGKKPGPLRLAALQWGRMWAWAFRKSGLDVNDRADDMVQRARAREAADASYALRNVLIEKEELEAVVGKGVKPRGRGKVSAEQKRLDALTRKLEKSVRPKAQAALEMADTQDPDQGLQLMQRMAWLTRADDVALLDYGPDSPAMTLLEELNIVANAEFVKSNKRAIEAGKTAKAAEETRRKAEQAVKEAADKLTAVETELEQTRKEAKESQQQMVAEREKEEKRLKSLRDERALLESSDATTGQLYQRTVKELEDARGQLTTLMQERGQLTTSTSKIQKEATLAREEVVRLEGERKALQERLDTAADERDRLTTAASKAEKQAQEARDHALRLEERLGTTADERDRLTTAASEAEKQAQEARDHALRLEERLASIERLQAAGVPARVQQTGQRVDARIGAGGGDTRQRIRDLLKEMSPEDRQQSQRKIAAQLMDEVGLGLDAVRNHLRAIDQEDAEAGGIPNPRAKDDAEDRDVVEDDESAASVHRPGRASSADR
ncbi:hypothetical protein ACFWHG_34280 [Streptomyces microflavus]|uniref:hypothetical protein n=1 Tax=Streptomyces microflavus TaxID=1919 RepID=UPI003650BF5C